jgi:tRNA(fMet)-specific endonuclease VapC
LKRYLLDTGIAADYLNRRGGAYVRARQAFSDGARLGLGAPVLGELWDGVFFSATRGFNETLLKRHLGHFALWPFDQVAAVEYGRLAAELRRRGRTMQQIDIQIAGSALTLADCTVVSKDSDLLDVPGLAVENWAQS